MHRVTEPLSFHVSYVLSAAYQLASKLKSPKGTTRDQRCAEYESQVEFKSQTLSLLFATPSLARERSLVASVLR